MTYEKSRDYSTDFNWSSRERASYVNGNYGTLASDDAEIDTALIRGLSEHHEQTPVINQFDSAIELGVGGVSRGPAFIAPLVRDGGRLYITDVSESNVRATRQDMQRIRNGNLGIWKPHEEHMTQSDPAWQGAFGRAAILGTYGQLDVEALKPDMADIISLGYLIESKGHDNYDEWEKDLRRVARAAIRLIHLRQSDNSEAYKAGDKTHLAVNVRREQTEEILENQGFRIIASHTVKASGQARQDNDHHAYSGFSGIIAERT